MLFSLLNGSVNTTNERKFFGVFSKKMESLCLEVILKNEYFYCLSSKIIIYLEFEAFALLLCHVTGFSRLKKLISLE